ncbi:hypothetical protein DXG03_003393 [Asterophora parasitica]|uniref:Iron hydrogenase large subunit C-terminal domain-containing protein n=1 Tax=Asterophora parasitica TaxID=117018 RepID=A0A9P7KAL4_9AGAR|nr:hypothetical protein DXG03_003393 [Asterophora parasitica]
MAFSGALTLTDLNDFITPSQACIKPVEQANPHKPAEKEPGAAATEIQVDGSGAYYEVIQNGTRSALTNGSSAAPAKKLEQAQINLNDCLACSGCITSAESVLITLQSHTEVLTFLEENEKNRSRVASKIPATDITLDNPTAAEPHKIPVISISPQTLASLAAAAAASPSTSTSTSSHPTPLQILRRIRAFCTEVLGFACVFDTTFARHLALQEHVAEFEERWRGAGEGGDKKGGELSAATTTVVGESAKGLPMLASSCPGWICYAEKAHAEMLPFISRTKSPQQVMGTLVKNWMGARWGKLPNEIYHITVMPCYDKKLEASRTDFYNDIYATRDVDCVITTGELELLMQQKGWDITQPVTGELDPPYQPTTSHGAFDPFPQHPHHEDSPSRTAMTASKSTIRCDADEVPSIHFPELLVHPGTSSGSYLNAVIAHLQATSPAPLTLQIQTIRGADFEEFVLSRDSSSLGGAPEVVFKGAKCYGFRNLQNVVRRVGRERGVRTTAGAAGKLGGRAAGGAGGLAARVRRRAAAGKEEERKERAYDYVEVMACPGGCVNGGGQLKPALSAVDTNATATTPPAPSVVDQEGYKRDWEGSGVSIMPPAPLLGMTGAIDVTQNARWGSKEWTRRVEEEYWRTPFSEVINRLADGLARRIINDLCGYGDEVERAETRRRYFRTEYRAVESEVIGLAVVW